MSRFDYVRYDDRAANTQATIKLEVEKLEQYVEHYVVSPNAKKLALQKLEEFYMWVGKGIRDDQIRRNGNTPLQEERSDS